MIRVGIDLGGTKIEGIALAGDGRAVAGRRVPTPRGDYDGTIRAVVGLVEGLEASAGERGTVGIGMPGAVSPRATGRPARYHEGAPIGGAGASGPNCHLILTGIGA